MYNNQMITACVDSDSVQHNISHDSRQWQMEGSHT